MHRLAGVLDQLLGKLELDKQAKTYRVLARWPAVAGKELARHSTPARVAGGILFVQVPSPVWGQQISLLKATILSRIREEVGSGIIRDIRCGPLSDQSMASAAESPPVEPDPPTAAERKAAEKLCGLLSDRELATAMVRVVSQQLALRRRRLQQGWVVCQSCSTLAPPRSVDACARCLDGKARRRVDKARLLLSQVPWCALERAQEEVPGLTDVEYRQVKETLAAQWESAYTRSMGGDPKLAAQSASLLTMLHSGLPPGQEGSAGESGRWSGGEAMARGARPITRDRRRQRRK